MVTIHSPTPIDAGTVDSEKRTAGLPRKIRSCLVPLFRRSPAVSIAACIAVSFAVAYLMAAPMGRDLSAQLAHAQLAELRWPTVLNLRWYGGFDPLGYSVLSPPVMALVGVRTPTGPSALVRLLLFEAL